MVTRAYRPGVRLARSKQQAATPISKEHFMAILTLIFGAIIGFVAGMIVAAGSWRHALNKLGMYAVNAARTPDIAIPAPTPMPMATRAEDPQR
jgi:hypothetical protein